MLEREKAGNVTDTKIEKASNIQTEKKRLSVVVPCYNEAATLDAFCAALTASFQGISKKYPHISFEVVFINDGSTDATLDLIKTAPQTSGLSVLAQVRYFSFSRNFGKEAGMYAGLTAATGDYVTTMDADLQDPPALLREMLSILFSGQYDSVAMRRVSRKGEPPIRSFFARAFYKLINRISDADIVDGARDFRLMSRQMVDAVLSLQERNRFTKGIFGWVGFKTYWLEYEHTDRIAGETSFSFWSLFKYAIEGIVSFSSTPLAISSAVGIFLSFIAVIFMIVLLVRAAIFGDAVAGWPSLMCTVLFVGGLQLLGIGVLGAYQARTYTETKKRPIYIVKEEGEIEQS